MNYGHGSNSPKTLSDCAKNDAISIPCEPRSGEEMSCKAESINQKINECVALASNICTKLFGVNDDETNGRCYPECTSGELDRASDKLDHLINVLYFTSNKM